jgi:hypothetical protein
LTDIDPTLDDSKFLENSDLFRFRALKQSLGEIQEGFTQGFPCVLPKACSDSGPEFDGRSIQVPHRWVDAQFNWPVINPEA